MILVSTSYRTMQSAIWEIFFELFCFLNIARAEGECNITETKRTRKIFPYCPLNRTITSLSLAQEIVA